MGTRSWKVEERRLQLLAFHHGRQITDRLSTAIIGPIQQLILKESLTRKHGTRQFEKQTVQEYSIDLIQAHKHIASFCRICSKLMPSKVTARHIWKVRCVHSNTRCIVVASTIFLIMYS